MVTVYIKKIDNIADSEKENIISSLSSSALARLNKKRNGKLFLSSLCALSLLSDSQRADLNYYESGCPFFSKLDADLSISHSKTYVAVAFSTSKSVPVGIDIEDNTDGTVSQRFLTESEQKSTTSPEKFLEIWTKKEALFKFLKNDSSPLIKLDSNAPKNYGAHFKTLQIDNSILTICTSPTEEINIINK